jgi:hypothetical protein
MIIGLLGPIGSGKTEAARHLAQAYGLEVLSVADPIRHMLKALGVPEDQFRGRNKDRPQGWLGNKTTRHLMETLGQWGRDQSATLWSGLLDARLASRELGRVGVSESDLNTATDVGDVREAPLFKTNGVVIDDIRLPLEAHTVRVRGGKLWRIDRKLTVGQSHIERAASMIDADVTITNSGTVSDLTRALDEAWQDANEVV